jgi:hypothetical protein
MNSNPLLVQLMQFYSVVYAVLKPAIIAYILLAFFLNTEKNTGSVKQQLEGLLYYVLQGIAFGLLSFGAIPPIIAVISGQQMQAEWYITFLFTFSSGGLLFLWADNKVRLLPSNAYAFIKMLFLGSIQIIGIVCITFTLISIAMATLYGQIRSPGWWSIPVCTITYGFLLTWLTAEVKPKFFLNTKKIVEQKTTEISKMVGTKKAVAVNKKASVTKKSSVKKVTAKSKTKKASTKKSSKVIAI